MNLLIHRSVGQEPKEHPRDLTEAVLFRVVYESLKYSHVRLPVNSSQTLIQLLFELFLCLFVQKLPEEIPMLLFAEVLLEVA